MDKHSIKTNEFGATGQVVTRIGLGGEGILRTTGKTEEAHSVIRAPVGEGITCYDSARGYSESGLYCCTFTAFLLPCRSG